MPGPVHSDLRTRTYAAHQALHAHPLVAGLASGSFSAQRYQSLLNAYLALYLSAERRRVALAVWPRFSLADAVAALRLDGAAISEEANWFDWVDTSTEALGMLYVTHGARQGGRLLATYVADKLPYTSRYFLQTGIKLSDWRALLAGIETIADDRAREELHDGAERAFRTFAACWDEAEGNRVEAT